MQLWQGELMPQNNVICKPVKVINPKISCYAGENKTYILQKGETNVETIVQGEVNNTDDLALDYSLKNKNSIT